MTLSTSTTESAGKSLSMKDRARAALLATPDIVQGAEFSAGGLAHVIRRREHPEHDALSAADDAAKPRTFTWLAAVEAWEQENPASDGNMRRICQALLAEGFLTRRDKVQGRYSWAYYKLAAVPA